MAKTDPLAALRQQRDDAALECDRVRLKIAPYRERGERRRALVALDRALPYDTEENYARSVGLSHKYRTEIGEIDGQDDPEIFASLSAEEHRVSAIQAALAKEYADQVPVVALDALLPLFEAAEVAQLAYAQALASIDSVAAYARDQAYIQRNGAPPEASPYWRCHREILQMIDVLHSRLGTRVERDETTGRQIFEAVENGSATYGDVSRFRPPHRPPPEGDRHINRDLSPGFETNPFAPPV